MTIGDNMLLSERRAADPHASFKQPKGGGDPATASPAPEIISNTRGRRIRSSEQTWVYSRKSHEFENPPPVFKEKPCLTEGYRLYPRHGKPFGTGRGRKTLRRVTDLFSRPRQGGRFFFFFFDSICFRDDQSVRRCLNGCLPMA